MTYIDFEKLKRVRTIDPFSFAPVDIEATIAFTGEVMRDNTRKDAKTMAEVGVAASRVYVDAPTPRLRQRLAILGWLPYRPSSDDRWYLDEPVELQSGDNHLVASFVAMYCAEGMNLLFAPGDGMFEGAAVVVAPGAGASDSELRSRVRLLAERAFVAKAMVVKTVPLSWFSEGVNGAIARDNAARTRAGLPLLAAPSESTLGRCLREFRSRNWNRAGIGADWRNYENPVAEPGRIEPAPVSRSPSAHPAGGKVAPGSFDETSNGITRAERVRTIMAAVRSAGRDNGSWKATDVGAGRTARQWVVDLGNGLRASTTTRFSGVPMAPSPAVAERARLAGLPPFEVDDAIVDLYLEGFGKVLSVATKDGVERLVGMTPGPWEASFGLPRRSWPPAVLRRLERRAST